MTRKGMWRNKRQRIREELDYRCGTIRVHVKKTNNHIRCSLSKAAMVTHIPSEVIWEMLQRYNGLWDTGDGFIIRR